MPQTAPLLSAFREVILSERLTHAVARLNPGLPSEAVHDAIRKVTLADAPTLIERNRAVHKMLVDGVDVEHRRADGSIAGVRARLIDFDNPDNNDWLAINQFTVMGGPHHRRPDVVIFVNGLPLAVIELKNAADEGATIWSAFQQLQTYQAQIPELFATNAALVISDGASARLGAVGAGKEWFKPWRTIEGKADAPKSLSELQVLLMGVFERRRFLDLIRYFIVFEDQGGGEVAKKIAGYHQMSAVNIAIDETLRASSSPGDRRVGVVWHTQGSGKSLTMAFYAGRVILHPAMANPTVVVITDRNDLDDQLFGTFARCQDLLRQPPVQVESRDDLRSKLQVSGGGVVFTTIQKFFPEGDTTTYPVLSDRRNIVVIADEAQPAGVGFEQRRRRRNQGGDDRVCVRSAGGAGTHSQQGSARGAGQAVPRPGRPVDDRHRSRHVAHRLRRAEPATETVKKNTTIDWTMRETVQAHLRVLVKRILRKHGYPPDKQQRATELVLEQAAVLSEGWAAGE